jgi:hypothetical protein
MIRTGAAPLAPLLVVVSLGCSAAVTQTPGAPAPGLSFPARLPDQAPEPTSEPAAPAADRTDLVPAVPPKAAELPDPPALMLERQWEYQLLYDCGAVSVVRVRPLLFEHPVATARRVGRYAVELWIGRELVDRVRFDFPALATEAPPGGPRHPLHEAPSLAEGAVVSRTIMVPASPRATRAELVDRATGQRTPLPWPPDAPLDPIAPTPDHQPDD